MFMLLNFLEFLEELLWIIFDIFISLCGIIFDIFIPLFGIIFDIFDSIDYFLEPIGGLSSLIFTATMLLLIVAIILAIKWTSELLWMFVKKSISELYIIMTTKKIIDKVPATVVYQTTSSTSSSYIYTPSGGIYIPEMTSYYTTLQCGSFREEINNRKLYFKTSIGDVIMVKDVKRFNKRTNKLVTRKLKKLRF